MIPSWQPILDAGEASVALAVVAAIAADLRLRDPADPTASQDPDPHHRPSLAGGAAGVALALGHLAAAGAEENRAAALASLGAAVDLLGSMDLPPGLLGGFTGVAWASEHLQGLLFPDGLDDPEADPNAAIDEALEELLAPSPWPGPYDLSEGLVGLGVYALERAPRPSARRLLAQVVERIGELAERQPGAIGWHTPRRLLPGDVHARYPGGVYNLGLAQGVPGVIALLGKSLDLPGAAELLDGAVAWLLGFRDGETARRGLPAIHTGRRSIYGGPGWAYGAPGVSVAILGAALRRRNHEWAQAAIALADEAADRLAAELGALDEVGLRSGTAGLAHQFNRLYQATGRAQYCDLARRCVARTLELRRPGSGVGGFVVSRYPDPTKQSSVSTSDPGLLHGAAGVALALHAAATAVPPAWDRALLIDLP